METNPYEPPDASEKAPPSTDLEPARRFTRLVAAFLDGIILLAVLMPIYYYTGFMERVKAGQVETIEDLTMSLLGMGIFLGLNGQLLANRGQTIGKMVTNIQIVNAQSGELLSFIRVYVYRHLWMLPLIVVTSIVPGQVDDLLVNVVFLIDILMIFGDDRRCLHDYIAGSKVVICREPA